jgi:ATP-dependent Clp protease protease subunit
MPSRRKLSEKFGAEAVASQPAVTRQAGPRSNDNSKPQNYVPEPTVIPSGTENNGRAWGLDSFLMHKSQTIFLSEMVTNETCADIKKRLLYLDSKFPGKDITIYIDSPGGSVSSGNSVVDLMNACHNDIVIIVAGDAASMGSVIALHGTPGKRFAMPSGKVMVHPPGYYGGGGPGGDATEVNIHARLLKNEYARGDAEYALCMGLDPHSKKDLNLVHRLTYRTTYLNATTAAKLGLIDDVIPIPEENLTDAKRQLQALNTEYDEKELAEIGDDLDEDVMAIVKKVIARREYYIEQQITNPKAVKNPFLEYAVEKEKIRRGIIKPDASPDAPRPGRS